MDSGSTINVHSCFVFKYVFIKTPTQFLLADVAMAGMKAQQSKVCQTSKSLQSPALAPGPPETRIGGGGTSLIGGRASQRPGLKLLLSSDLLNIWMFHISKLKLIILIKLKSVSRTWALGSSGRKYETEFKICLKWK